MKRLNQLFLVVFCGIVLSGVFVSGYSKIQAQTSPINYPEINTALKTKLPNRVFKTKDQLITWVISQIKIRKVDKPLTKDREEDLKQAGATEELIEVIRQNSPALTESPKWLSELVKNPIIPKVGMAGIKMGMAEADVIKILGSPIQLNPVFINGKLAYYALLYQFKEITLGIYTSTPEHQVSAFRVYDENFNQNNFIKGTDEGLSIGSSLDQLIKLKGQPTAPLAIHDQCYRLTSDGKSTHYYYEGITFIVCQSNKLIYMIDVR
ncbi:MAG: hypothetical protein K1X72_23320 [Pyrinomonadaceae bacterium]|nr:hypothetical protein [Pyrinomonadaceae bacterium]